MLQRRPVLRVNATIDTSGREHRIIITFSQMRSAQNYNEYLKGLENSFYQVYNCRYDERGNGYPVSLDLPLDVTLSQDNSTVVFKDEEKAAVWEKQMILWGQGERPVEKQRTILRYWEANELNEKLGVLGQINNDIEINQPGFHVQTSARSANLSFSSRH